MKHYTAVHYAVDLNDISKLSKENSILIDTLLAKQDQFSDNPSQRLSLEIAEIIKNIENISNQIKIKQENCDLYAAKIDELKKQEDTLATKFSSIDINDNSSSSIIKQKLPSTSSAAVNYRGTKALLKAENNSEESNPRKHANSSNQESDNSDEESNKAASTSKKAKRR